MTPRKKQIFLILMVFIGVVCVDQASKAVIMHKMPDSTRAYYEGAEPPFFHLTHRRNPGVVGGIFTNVPFLAYAAPLLATGVLLYLFRYLESASKIQALAYGLVAGGAVGNYIDRIRFGSVTDFLQFYFYFIPFDFSWKYYPAFNAADSAICTGVFLLIVSWYVLGPSNAVDPA